MALDTKHNPDWFGQLEIQGVREHQQFTGTIQNMLAKMLAAMMASTPRLNSMGDKEIVLRFNVKPFNKSDQPLTMEQQVMRDLMEMGLGEPDEILDEEQTKLVNASLPPWHNDSLWHQFQYYQFSDRNYSEASPGEIRSLQDQLRAKYGDDPRLENALIDRRAR